MDEINHFEGVISEKTSLGELILPNGNGMGSNDKEYFNYTVQTTKKLIITCYSQKSFKINDHVDVIIKAESIRVKTQSETNQKQVEENAEKTKKISILGIVESKYFLGNWSKLRVKNDSCSWVIKLPSIRAGKYEVGQMLQLSYRPYNILLLLKNNSIGAD